MSYKIVIADDNPEIAKTVADEIHRLADRFKKQLIVKSALSGFEVVEISKTEDIDVFIIDYMFNYGMTGSEVIEYINGNDPFQSKFFVIMSGWKEEELEGVINKSHYLYKNRIKFLRKPYDALTIMSILLEIFNFLEKRPYPLPLQYVYNNFTQQSDGLERLLTIKDFFENLLKFSIGVFMADLSIKGKSHHACINIKPQSKITFGALINWLKSILSSVNLSDSFSSELFNFYVNNQEVIGKMQEFKEFRDNNLGHGYKKDENWYKKQSESISPNVDNIFKKLQFLNKYHLVYVDKINLIDNHTFEYDLIYLMAPQQIPQRVKFTSESNIFSTGKIFLHLPEKGNLSLSPFVTYKMCEICEKDQLYMLDSIEQNHLVFNSFCNHKYKDTQLIKAFNEQFSSYFRNFR